MTLQKKILTVELSYTQNWQWYYNFVIVSLPINLTDLYLHREYCIAEFVRCGQSVYSAWDNCVSWRMYLDKMKALFDKRLHVNGLDKLEVM